MEIMKYNPYGGEPPNELWRCMNCGRIDIPANYRKPAEEKLACPQCASAAITIFDPNYAKRFIKVENKSTKLTRRGV